MSIQEFHVYRTPYEWGYGSTLIEIGPGRYAHKHWQPGFGFVDDCSFAYASGIIRRHFPEYDCYGMQDIECAIGQRIIADWLIAAERLPACSIQEAKALLGFVPDSTLHDFPAECPAIVAMLKELAALCSAFYADNEHICVLGL